MDAGYLLALPLGMVARLGPWGLRVVVQKPPPDPGISAVSFSRPTSRSANVGASFPVVSHPTLDSAKLPKEPSSGSVYVASRFLAPGAQRLLRLGSRACPSSCDPPRIALPPHRVLTRLRDPVEATTVLRNIVPVFGRVAAARYPARLRGLGAAAASLYHLSAFPASAALHRGGLDRLRLGDFCVGALRSARGTIPGLSVRSFRGCIDSARS